MSVAGGCDSLGGDGVFVAEKLVDSDRFVAFSELGVAFCEVKYWLVGLVWPLAWVSDFEVFAGAFAGRHGDVDGGVRVAGVELGEFVFGAGEADS